MRLEAWRKKYRHLLPFLSQLYRWGVQLRHWAYECGFFKIKKVPAVVISIGNITAGGTGKTPLVHFLAEELSKHSTVAILSRGYRSKAEKQKSPIHVQPSMCAEDVGDEPLWLAQKLPAVQVWVSARRYHSALKAIENGAQILLLDDGFQHRSLHRDFDVVCMAENLKSDFLPSGDLRDLPSRLSSAHLLVAVGPASSTTHVVFQRQSPLNLQGKKVALFCAIANPSRFVEHVQSLGADVLTSLIKPDHEPFSFEEIEMLAKQSKAELLVCTEKDFVKLRPLQPPIPLMPIPLQLKISAGHEAWKQFIENIQSQVHHVRRIPSHAA